MKKPQITKEQFEKEYAERSKVTIDFLKKHNQIVVPCDCDFPGCRGWQMVTNQITQDLEDKLNQETEELEGR